MKDWREQYPLRTFGGETYKQLVRQIEGILEEDRKEIYREIEKRQFKNKYGFIPLGTEVWFEVENQDQWKGDRKGILEYIDDDFVIRTENTGIITIDEGYDAYWNTIYPVEGNKEIELLKGVMYDNYSAKISKSLSEGRQEDRKRIVKMAIEKLNDKYKEMDGCNVPAEQVGYGFAISDLKEVISIIK